MFLFGLATSKTVMDHSGWGFPWDPFHRIFRNNSDFHDIHHQVRV